MSKIIKNALLRGKPNYYPNPLRQGQHKVIPPPPVPQHIQKPPYVTSSTPIYGLYQGKPTVHTPQTINKLRYAAKVASNTLSAAQQFIKSKLASNADLSEEQIDRFVYEDIIRQGAYPTPIGFMNFPKSVCVSVNECIVHGIPSTRKLERGDKVNLDVTVYIDGVHGDNNLTLLYGPPRFQEVEEIVKVTQQALYQGIRICKPGVKYSQIGLAIGSFARKNKVHVCQSFTGHGVGQLLHMPPQVFHGDFPMINQTMELGHVFTIEPILSLYPTDTLEVWDDNFTTISANNPNAQFQHTLLIVENGCQVLTKRSNEVIPK